MGCPTTLYKYCPPERIDIIDGAMLRYTPLGSFNDPFEGRPEITDIVNEEEIQKEIEMQVSKTLEETYQNLPDNQKRLLSFDHFLTISSSTLPEIKDRAIRTLSENLPSLRNVIYSAIDSAIGALCLTEVPDNLLMWSHYSQSHTGFVLEFDAHHEYFHSKTSDKDELRHLRRVLYRGARPSMTLRALTAPNIFLVKSVHWAYEQEWRILRPLKEASKTINENHLFEFPRDALTSVTIGARANKDMEEKIISILNKHPEYQSVKLFRARPDDSHFLLRITEFKRK